jgi:hypothetical protein
MTTPTLDDAEWIAEMKKIIPPIKPEPLESDES